MEFISKYPDLQIRFDKIEVELERTISTAQRKLAVERLKELLKGNGNALPLADLSTVLHIHRQTLWRILEGSNLPSGINAASILHVCHTINKIRNHYDNILVNWPKLRSERDSLGLFLPSIFHNTLNGDLKYTDRLNRLVKLHIKFWASSMGG